MPQIAEPITSLEQELESQRDWYKKVVKKIQDIMSWDDKDIDEKYWEIYEYTRTALDGEPTTADEHNVVRISDVNKEIAVDWKNREREEKIKKKSNIIQCIGYRGEGDL